MSRTDTNDRVPIRSERRLQRLGRSLSLGSCLLALACSNSSVTSSQSRPLSTASSAAPPVAATSDWHECVRRGAALRGDPLCNGLACDAAEWQNAECYRQVWRTRGESIHQDDDLSPLGPRWAFQHVNAVEEADGIRFLDEGDKGYISSLSFAKTVCDKLPNIPRSSCIAEVVYGVDRLVWQVGGFGAGP